MKSNAKSAVAGVLVTIGLVTAVWWYVSARGLVRPIFLPPPASVAEAAVRLTRDGTLQSDFLATFLRVGSACLWSVGLGVSVGLLLGMYELAALAADSETAMSE